MTFKLMIALIGAVIAIGQCATILDILGLHNDKKLIDSPMHRSDQQNRNCLCKGPACVCCVDFNMTIVDLGGPGCVHMKYVPEEDNDAFLVKVSYGKNLIHNSKIHGSHPTPICLDVFGSFAQVCAKFFDMAPTANGFRGCLELQPKLMGTTQVEFPVGCFKSADGGMEMEDPTEAPETSTEESSPEDDKEETFDAEDFLLGVYKTAEQGVAFLSSLLDIPRNSTKTTTTPKPAVTAERKSKTLKHPNKL